MSGPQLIESGRQIPYVDMLYDVSDVLEMTTLINLLKRVNNYGGLGPRFGSN